MGFHISETSWPYQNWSYVQFPAAIPLPELNSDSVEVFFYSFTIIIDDTTYSRIITQDDRVDTVRYFKDSIRIVFANGVQFIDLHTKEHLIRDKNGKSYYFCDESRYYPKLMLKIENLTKRSCDYSLYYSPACDLPSEESLLRYGKIKLRRNRKYRPPAGL